MNLEVAAVEDSLARPPAGFVEILRKLMHEMSQPLTSLRGSLEVALLGETLDPNCREIVERSLGEVERLAAAMAGLREVLEAEDPGEASQRVNWKTLVRKALEEFAPEARRQGSRVVLNPLRDAYVRINPPRVEACLLQIFRRLMLEGARGKVLRVGLSVRKGSASLQVCDGAAPAGKPAVAARESNVQEDSYHPGLAWWILRRSIEVQGGKLETEKIPSRRVCCRVTFPLASSSVRGKSAP